MDDVFDPLESLLGDQPASVRDAARWGVPVALFAVAGLILVGVARRRGESEAVEDEGPEEEAGASMQIPDVSGLVRPEVFSGFSDFTAQFEGKVATMYLDVSGLVTTGIGNLIDPIELAQPLPWQRPDGTTASRGEVIAEWRRVKAMPKALVASRYATPEALRLSDEGIALLVKKHLANDIRYLVKVFPDFPSYPAPAQTAILSMSWALGAGFASGFPTCAAAIRAQDWGKAADNCKIKEAGNPGVAPRNKANRELFLEAARA